MTFSLYTGNCLEVMKNMEDGCVDSIVTDPPYGLSFMGRKWDYDVPSVEIWAECLRVLKPGGHLLAFAGTRTQHRMCVRIEDAGFEIRDMIAWVYGSGFPKSHNGEWGGTALKPALEPITLARKPLDGTVASNYGAHGTGGLNIDGYRIGETGGTEKLKTERNRKSVSAYGLGLNGGVVQAIDAGRWPANLIHDGSEEVLAAFPQTTSGGGERNGAAKGGVFGDYSGNDAPRSFEANSGSAARFFYCSKASRKDRNDGLPSSNEKAVSTNARMRDVENADWARRNGNHHPTVKPTDLMRYLCRLVTPPGGTVLDPFMGSGSTGKAAKLEGFQFVGVDMEAEYVAMAEARIADAEKERENELKTIEDAQRQQRMF